jgi:ureidoglycolate lyase
MTEILKVRPLTREAFAPFGDVLEATGAHHYPINNGTTMRYHDLAKVEATGPGARVMISIARGDAFFLPLEIRMVERHPLGSQAFFPLHGRPWLVVVAQDAGGTPKDPVAFLVRPDANGLRGVNYHCNVWHHPLVTLEEQGDFLVVDRGGEGNNLEEHFYERRFAIEELPAV